jgi:hypothetical protein
MENQLYDRDKVLELVLADSGDENSDSEDELVADVQDEFGQEMTLPDMRTNVSAHEREPLLFLDEELNEVSITIILSHSTVICAKYYRYNADNMNIIYMNRHHNINTSCLVLYFYFLA